MGIPAAFHDQVAAWHDYYLLAGTASATLMGLLFVSLSIHLERVVSEEGAHLEAMAREAFASFLIVLFVSLILLSPDSAQRPMGLSLLVMGGLRILLSLRRIGKVLAAGAQHSVPDRRYFLMRFSLSLIASVLLITAAFAMFSARTEAGLAAIMVASVFLLADAARSSYELLVRTARMRRPPH
jgi:hypothetical protein